MTIQHNFNNESGTDYLSTISDDNYNLDTAFGRQQYFDAVLNDPDFTKYDADVIAMRLGDVGKDEMYNYLKEMADMSSGQLGLMHSIERNVDNGLSRFDGSLSQNLSEGAQLKHEVLELSTPDTLNFNAPHVPLIGNNNNDLQIAVYFIYEQLIEAGVPESDLNHAMAAGGIDNDRATVGAFYDLAQDNDVALSDYIQNVDQAYVGVMRADGIKDIEAIVGTVIEEPELTANDYEYEQKIAPPVMGAMGAA